MVKGALFPACYECYDIERLGMETLSYLSVTFLGQLSCSYPPAENLWLRKAECRYPGDRYL